MRPSLPPRLSPSVASLKDRRQSASAGTQCSPPLLSDLLSMLHVPSAVAHPNPMTAVPISLIEDAVTPAYPSESQYYQGGALPNGLLSLKFETPSY